MHNAQLWLESIHPATPWALLTVAIFAAVWLTRKTLPSLWTWFDTVTPDGTLGHIVQGLPAIGIGAIATVVLTGGDFALAWKGAVFGALAPVLHLVLKAVPVPYQGAVRAVAKKTGLVALILLVTACAGSFEEAKGVSMKIGAPPASPRCIDLDNRHAWTGGASKFSAALSGGAGLAVLPVEDEHAKLALGISSAVLAGVAVGAGYVSDSASTSWARECAAP